MEISPTGKKDWTVLAVAKREGLLRIAFWGFVDKTCGSISFVCKAYSAELNRLLEERDLLAISKALLVERGL